MMIGQIVFINDKNLLNVQTGIITKREKEEQGSHVRYEVLCNDGQNHVFSAYLLSPATRTIKTSSAKKCKKATNFMQACTNTAINRLNYIHNQTQKLKTFTHK